ncbi:MAG: hypothetical protein CMI18_02555 [Opitutaceae bacterium]|nr:hypothetical protein [Opitutaceae bacterium]
MNVLFQDKHILVVNKPARIVTEGPDHNKRDSLEKQLIARLEQVLWPCHRLDRDTTGAIIFAKSKSGKACIAKQFEKRQVRKSYLVCVHGEWQPEWNRVETHIARTTSGKMANTNRGKRSITTFRKLAFWNGKSLLEALVKTGRRHQIRLHCLHHQCPILGDRIYGKRAVNDPPMALHARQIRFRHPSTEAGLTVDASLPDYWHNHWLKDCPINI